MAMASRPVIANRGEFIDALNALRRGHVLVRGNGPRADCVLDGGRVLFSYDTLVRYELISEYDNPDGFPSLHYYRLTDRGRDFAERACAAWRQRPLVERLALRLIG